MRFNTSIEHEANKARTNLEYLISKQKVIDQTAVREKRSISQNSYLHLIVAIFALEYGELASYVKKEFFKIKCNPEIFKTEYVNKKTGEVRDDLRSSSDLDTKEMTICIDRFRDYASKEAGIYLPEPNDMEFIRHCENDIENNKQYL